MCGLVQFIRDLIYNNRMISIVMNRCSRMRGRHRLLFCGRGPSDPISILDLLYNRDLQVAERAKDHQPLRLAFAFSGAGFRFLDAAVPSS